MKQHTPHPTVLHVTSGDCAGDKLARSGIPGEILVWHDVLYDGPVREPGWPDEDTLSARVRFLDNVTGGALGRESIIVTLREQYAKIGQAGDYDRTVLWFDACLFDQSMLAHILCCLRQKQVSNVYLLCVDFFPGIEPYHGIGQLEPADLNSLYGRETLVSDAQYAFAWEVDLAFGKRDSVLLRKLGEADAPPLPWVPCAARRWLAEWPDASTGLGRLESMALDAVRAGCFTPAAILAAVSAAETPPQFWGDITLWGKLNALASRTPPLIRIDGPSPELPQWSGIGDLSLFRVTSY